MIRFSLRQQENVFSVCARLCVFSQVTERIFLLFVVIATQDNIQSKPIVCALFYLWNILGLLRYVAVIWLSCPQVLYVVLQGRRMYDDVLDMSYYVSGACGYIFQTWRQGRFSSVNIGSWWWGVGVGESWGRLHKFS